MKEYRDLREKVGFLELCKSPDLVCQATTTAVRKINADAAIIFADILLILEPMGFELTFDRGEGPVIHNPFQTAAEKRTPRSPSHSCARRFDSYGANSKNRFL
jgi:uroporphyrinogen decarboxylase